MALTTAMLSVLAGVDVDGGEEVLLLGVQAWPVAVLGLDP
jgi:hypothetical protein